ncbi:hypothetical protein ALC60_11397 [Trachymyrmex zeteki]|uniref:Uncharacterized protein n=1 Tax=Mycetomoellerius zeteki TaxID=64791 RepID=A0A151WNQ2_9HYME|nr:hypothetical protein ALC60_11397 [Trachymyrmex zeteki]
MTEMLERALAPLLIIGSFCNLGVFEYPFGQPRLYFSCLYAMAKCSFLTYYYYYPLYINDLHNRIIFFTDVFPLITIVLIFICLYRSKELKMCLRELAITDETLEALGTPKEYQRLNNWIIRIIIGWIVYIFFG